MRRIAASEIMKDCYGKDISHLHSKKLYLFDMDGTVYLDDNIFDGVKELLEKITKMGARYVFITNNSSRSVSDYVAKMHRIGLDFITEEHFFTSVHASLILMKEKHSTDLIYLQGTKSFVKEFVDRGFNVATSYTELAKVVLVAFDPEFTGEKIYNTCKILTKCDVKYYATNPDWVCPVDFGYIPDCGAMCKSIELATGKKPYFIGKPEPEMVFAVMKKYGVQAKDTVVIGDRLYTDIASGNNAGVDTVCVLTGEVKKEEVDKAVGVERPTYLLNHVKDLI